MKLCEDNSKTSRQFKRVLSFEEDYRIREVVIEQLMRARPFTFIRVIDTDESDVFVLLFCLLPLNFSPQGKPPIGIEINVT